MHEEPQSGLLCAIGSPYHFRVVADGEMDSLAFIASIIGSLAWPAVIVVLLVFLRPHLSDLASRLAEVSFPGGAKATFLKKLESAREQSEQLVSEQPKNLLRSPPRVAEDLRPKDPALELAADFPEAAVVQAFRNVERTILDGMEKLGDRPSRRYLRDYMRDLRKRQVISDHALELFETLRQARNAAAYGARSETTSASSGISASSAIEFVEQCQLLSDILFKSIELAASLNNIPR